MNTEEIIAVLRDIERSGSAGAQLGGFTEAAAETALGLGAVELFITRTGLTDSTIRVGFAPTNDLHWIAKQKLSFVSDHRHPDEVLVLRMTPVGRLVLDAFALGRAGAD